MKFSSNRIYEPFVMIFIVIAGLLFFSFYNSEFDFGFFQTKKISLVSEILSKGQLKQVPATEKVLSDSIIIKSHREIELKKKDLSNIVQYVSNDSTGGLFYFLNALDQTKKKGKKTRIAYFGDSMIEGDLISQDLRSLFQKYFGGEGVGFMPVTSIVSGFRQSIIHSFSTNWQEYNLLNNSPASHPLGITGHVFVPPVVGAIVDSNSLNTSCWVKYSGVSRPNLNRFFDVRLFYGPVNKGQNYVSTTFGSKKLDGTEPVNQVRLNNGKVTSSIQVGFQCQSPVNIYGFSLESDSGVFVDNLSFRGNSGMPLVKMPYEILNGLDNYLGYDLIILQYGVNVISHNLTDYSYYEKGMTEVVEHLKKSFPKASVLIITTGDKGYKTNGEWATDPAVPIVVEAQRKVAEKNNIAFWNLYESMGGYNSIVKWVEGDTVLANKDYTHLNFKGATKIGTLLYNKLISEYSDYKKKS